MATQIDCSRPIISDLPFKDSILETNNLVESTLKIFQREVVDYLVCFCEHTVNGPVKYHKDKITTLLQIFHNMCKESEEKISLNYQGLLSLSGKIESQLRDQSKNPDEYRLFNNWLEDPLRFSLQEKMERALNEINPKNGEVIRLLELGNNDQSTPMVVAQQVKHILLYAKNKNLNLSVQVLLMGKGGHATTQMFHQFAEVNNDEWIGVTEADSLVQILCHALRQEEIDYMFDVDHFNNLVYDKVQIKLARNSRNTGENVEEANKVYEADHVQSKHVFVCSATLGSARQAQTFAKSYSSDGSNPLSEKYYDTITSIPPTRSREFIVQALDDHQIITELYAGFAEMARHFAYGFNQDRAFIPAAPIDLQRLDTLYEVYWTLSGTQDPEASKLETIDKVQAFFQSRFQIMEKSIKWNKDRKAQIKMTQQAMKKMTFSYLLKTKKSQTTG